MPRSKQKRPITQEEGLWIDPGNTEDVDVDLNEGNHDSDESYHYHESSDSNSDNDNDNDSLSKYKQAKMTPKNTKTKTKTTTKLQNDGTNGIWPFEEILDHKGPFQQAGDNNADYKNSLYNVLIQWENGERTWEPLNKIMTYAWIPCAIYAKRHGLTNTRGWKKFKDYTEHKDKGNSEEEEEEGLQVPSRSPGNRTAAAVAATVTPDATTAAVLDKNKRSSSICRWNQTRKSIKRRRIICEEEEEDDAPVTALVGGRDDSEFELQDTEDEEEEVDETSRVGRLCRLHPHKDVNTTRKDHRDYNLRNSVEDHHTNYNIRSSDSNPPQASSRTNKNRRHSQDSNGKNNDHDSERNNESESEDEFTFTNSDTDTDTDLNVVTPHRVYPSRINHKNRRQNNKNNFYCCPVCYVEAYRRLELGIRPTDTVEDDDPGTVHENDDNDDDYNDTDGNDDIVTSNFEVGPFEILQCVDPSLEIASAFCFSRLTHVKEHLKRDHAIITNSRRENTNDIFHRFHSSQSDGLALRYLRKLNPDTMKGLGYTHDYFDHVQEELKLLQTNMRRHGRPYHRNSRSPTTNDNRAMLDERIAVFWSSFAVRSHRIWRALQQPYQNEDDNDEDDDDEEEEDDFDAAAAIQHDLFDRQGEHNLAKEEEEKEIVDYIRELQEKHNIHDDDEAEDDKEGMELVDTDDDDYSNWNKGFLKNINDDSEDDSSSVDVATDSDSSQVRSTEDREEEGENIYYVPLSSRTCAKKKRRRTAIEDDDDENETGNDNEVQCVVV